jgi:hypothetical protein
MRVNPNMMITSATMISSSGRPIEVLPWRVTSERSAESMAVSRALEHQKALAPERAAASTLMLVPACSPAPV